MGEQYLTLSKLESQKGAHNKVRCLVVRVHSLKRSKERFGGPRINSFRVATKTNDLVQLLCAWREACLHWLLCTHPFFEPNSAIGHGRVDDCGWMCSPGKGTSCTSTNQIVCFFFFLWGANQRYKWFCLSFRENYVDQARRNIFKNALQPVPVRRFSFPASSIPCDFIRFEFGFVVETTIDISTNMIRMHVRSNL